MTVDEWLSARAPRPPAALDERVRLALGASLSRDVSLCTELCLEAGARLVTDLLRSDSTARESAIDLLAADALVTYAFEAASGQPAAIGARAASAMVRIAALGTAAATP